MKLGSIRELSGMRPVLKDPSASGNDPVYWVLSDVSDNEWANVTIIVSGLYDEEYPKTFGHYHPEEAVDETYHLMEGEGVLQLQKKHIENGQLIPDMVDGVYLVKARPGDEVVIKPEYGHSWSNVGKGPLISFDDWRSGHTYSEYEPIKQMQGLAYYLVEEDGQLKVVPNPKYKDLPEPKWITASEFRQLQTL